MLTLKIILITSFCYSIFVSQFSEFTEILIAKNSFIENSSTRQNESLPTKLFPINLISKKGRTLEKDWKGNAYLSGTLLPRLVGKA